MNLPDLYDPSFKYFYPLAGTLIWTIFYLGVERSLIFTPYKVPQLAIDQFIPFQPWTIWIYQATGPFVLLAYILTTEPSTLNSLLFAFPALVISSAFFFFFFPTTIPRDIYPIPESADRWTKWNFEKLRAVDKPVNCVPSMHVSLTILFAGLFYESKQHYFPYFAAFGLAIIISTTTTKQHYFIDVIAGAIVGILVYALFF